MVKKKMRELNEEKNRMLHYYSETSALMSVYEKRKVCIQYFLPMFANINVDCCETRNVLQIKIYLWNIFCNLQTVEDSKPQRKKSITVFYC